MALFVTACEAFGGGETLVLDSMEVTVPGSVHDIRLAGAGATDSITPAAVTASPGDAVRFVAADRRPHAVTFVVDELSPEIREFLDRTGQLRGPPLVSEGAAWIVLLEGAPPGSYPFVCRPHDARGELTVIPDG
ncbi:MAG: plastocyanin/azurin family copper-binding protein [Gemmatimonadota bacterium]